MHMLMVIAGGIWQLGIFALFGWLWGGTMTSFALAAKAFIPVWLVVSLLNMWIGVTKAGYSLQDELPILAVVFLVPASIAVLAVWFVSRP
ncbi:hypothetical protein ACFFP0_26605 [Rhizobium puerariae]|uniref:Transmembrane protein n=1 Tax=Rhizobium puerariae TaxID=1585791 RepID=A0ABV6AP86_9HYPH